MLCSVLLPTRERPAKAISAMERLFVSGNPRDFEVLVAVDDDDPFASEIIDYAGLCARLNCRVRIFTAPRGKGWFGLNQRLTDLANASPAEWVWIMNDDCFVSGPWTERLREAPQGLVHPEFHKLNDSVYHNDASSGFPLVPNKIWERHGHSMLVHPADLFLNELCKEHGYPTTFLKDVTIHHQRVADHILAPEML